MSNVELPRTTSLLIPPYDSFIPPNQIDYCPERGVAAVWFVRDGASQLAEREWLAERPNGVELVVVLPPPAAIRNALPLLRDLNVLRPRGILPNGPLTTPEPVKLLLSSSPRDLAAVVVSHLARGGVLRNQRIRGLVGKIFEMAPTVPSISKLARKLYTSRRTLGRYFEGEGLPVPSHWLQFARLMHVSLMIQERHEMPIFRAAMHVGYPDGFTMSNQMKRLIGCRPSDVRENLGYEWILEEWIKREQQMGRLILDVDNWRLPTMSGWLSSHPAKRPMD